MADLSHWDAAIDFTGKEAAALASGVDPAQSGDGPGISKPLYDRMASCYNARRLWHMRGGPQECDEPYSCEPDQMLESNEMQWLAKYGDGDDDHRFSDWLKDEVRSRFESQRFARIELARWLLAIGTTSKYKFGDMQVIAEDKQVARWPWGNHHTKSLGYLEAAAKKWWVNFDPSDMSTAPLNRDVVKWLKSEFKISENKAKSIASILRSDDVPTGPHS